MDLGLAGKAAAITGGSRGIGYATAHSLAREGARVLIAARSAERLEQAASELSEATGGEIVPCQADVSQPEDVERVIQTAAQRFGRLDIFISNAGTSFARSILEVSDEQWRYDLDSKLMAAVRGARSAVPHLKLAGGGSIISVLNIGAKTPAARSVPTSVSRAAGMALTKALSKELAPDRIRVNAVLIGLARSWQHESRWLAGGQRQTLDSYYEELASKAGVPIGRICEADEVGDLIAFLCSERASYLSGVAINMDGGLSNAV